MKYNNDGSCTIYREQDGIKPFLNREGRIKTYFLTKSYDWVVDPSFLYIDIS